MHTTLCGHATGTTVDYVKQAHALGLQEIGFSCHSPMAEFFDDWRMLREDLPGYVDMVAQARAHGEALGITVRMGLEVDYLPGQRPWIETLATLAPWDYLIGSVHYLTESLIVDHPEHLSLLKERPVEWVWERYWALFAEAAETSLFDFMAHPDLPKKFSYVPEGDLTSYYLVGINAMAKTGTGFEINTAGLRKPVAEIYPTPQFLKMAHEQGLPLVISSDAHAPEEVGADFALAKTLAQAAGYTESARYEKRQRRFVKL